MAKGTVNRTRQLRPERYSPRSFLGSKTWVSYESEVLHNTGRQPNLPGLRKITSSNGKAGSGLLPAILRKPHLHMTSAE